MMCGVKDGVMDGMCLKNLSVLGGISGGSLSSGGLNSSLSNNGGNFGLSSSRGSNGGLSSSSGGGNGGLSGRRGRGRRTSSGGGGSSSSGSDLGSNSLLTALGFSLLGLDEVNLLLVDGDDGVGDGSLGERRTDGDQVKQSEAVDGVADGGRGLGGAGSGEVSEGAVAINDLLFIRGDNELFLVALVKTGLAGSISLLAGLLAGKVVLVILLALLILLESPLAVTDGTLGLEVVDLAVDRFDLARDDGDRVV
mmetsp:Transcript_11617/g.18906  ORF Transcript_11617/g.18906 Transcript_11617/m.18906 type:complete len:252 (+) Transcript_11617:113-868(+)